MFYACLTQRLFELLSLLHGKFHDETLKRHVFVCGAFACQGNAAKATNVGKTFVAVHMALIYQVFTSCKTLGLIAGIFFYCLFLNFIFGRAFHTWRQTWSSLQLQRSGFIQTFNHFFYSKLVRDIPDEKRTS